MWRKLENWWLNGSSVRILAIWFVSTVIATIFLPFACNDGRLIREENYKPMKELVSTIIETQSLPRSFDSTTIDKYTIDYEGADRAQITVKSTWFEAVEANLMIGEAGDYQLEGKVKEKNDILGAVYRFLVLGMFAGMPLFIILFMLYCSIENMLIRKTRK